MTKPAAEIAPQHHDRGSLHKPLTTGLDHIGLTVADLDRSIDELASFFGGGRCYLEGPIQDPEPGWMQRKLGARSGQFCLHVAATRVADFNLELFDYRPVETRPQQGCGADQAFFVLLHACTDPGAFLAQHAGRITQVRGTPRSWLDIQTHSGLRLWIRKADQPSLTPAIVLGCEHAHRVKDEATFDFGLKVQHAIDTPFGTGAVLRGSQGGRIVLVAAPRLLELPANSDIGGFHLGFHANDVDQAARAYAKTGYRVMGTPETIADGPIAGDRWVYLRSPGGIQMEIINMPDGRLPYEADATFLRQPISGKD